MKNLFNLKHNKNIKINIKVPDKFYIPEYKTKGASGFDIRAYIEDDIGYKIIKPDEISIINTGLFVEIPEGLEIQIRPRSGLASKGLIILNSPGTIDSDYRGEIKIIFKNLGNENFIINKGDRIAQGILAPFYHCDFILNTSNELSVTDRGVGGFGSTGLK